MGDAMPSSPATHGIALVPVVVCLIALCGCASAGRSATPPVSASAPAASASTASVTATSGAAVVPDMSGTGADEASAVLRRLDFAVAFYDEEGWADSPSDPAFGTVVSQYPRGGEPWPPGGTVKLGLAVPDGMVSVPDVEGLADAEGLIRAAGLRPLVISVHGPVDPDAAGIGKAYRQRPRPGTILKRGSEVAYRIWGESQ